MSKSRRRTVSSVTTRKANPPGSVFEAPPVPVDTRTSQWFSTTGLAKYLQNLANRTHRLVIDAGDPRFNLPWNNDAVDSVPPWEKFIAQVPDNATIALTVPGFLARKTDAPLLSARRGITITTLKTPHPDGGWEAVSRFLWGSSTPGGRLAYIESCDACIFDGVNLEVDRMNVADIGFDVDLTGLKGPGGNCTGTACEFNTVRVRPSRPNPNFIGIRISEVSKSNQEYHVIRNATVSGGTDVLQMWGLHGAAGDTLLHVDWEFPSYFVSPNSIGFRLPRAKRAIVDGVEIRTALHGTCVVLDQHTIRLDQPLDYAFDDPVMRAVPAAKVYHKDSHRYAQSAKQSRILLRETMGVGVQIGDSFNAKRIRLEGGSYSGLLYAVWCKNGSLITKAVNLPNNEVNYRLERGSEYWHLEDDNSEASRRHLLLGTGMPVTCAPSRLDNSYQEPGTGYIEGFANASCPLHMHGGCVDQNVPELGTTIFEATPSSMRLHLHDTVFTPIHWKDTGIETFRSYYDVYNCPGIYDMPAAHATYAGDHGAKANVRHLTYRTNNVQGGAADVVHMIADTNDGTPYVARETVIDPHYGRNEIIAHRRVIGDPRKKDGTHVVDEVHLTTFVLDETIFPHYEGANRAPGAFLMHRLVPPVLGPEAGVMEEMALYDVRDFAKSGAAHHYVYLRTDMDMELLGRVLLGVPRGVPDDARIPIGAGIFFRDPTSRALCMRIKEDDGTAITYLLSDKVTP